MKFIGIETVTTFTLELNSDEMGTILRALDDKAESLPKGEVREAISKLISDFDYILTTSE